MDTESIENLTQLKLEFVLSSTISAVFMKTGDETGTVCAHLLSALVI